MDACEEGVVEESDVVVDQACRPTVGGDVMNDSRNEVKVGGNFDNGEARGYVFPQVERTRIFLE